MIIIITNRDKEYSQKGTNVKLFLIEIKQQSTTINRYKLYILIGFIYESEKEVKVGEGMESKWKSIL